MEEKPRTRIAADFQFPCDKFPFPRDKFNSPARTRLLIQTMKKSRITYIESHGKKCENSVKFSLKCLFFLVHLKS